MSLSVRTEVVVEATPDRAFRVFTEKAENWWPPDHHIGKAPLKNVTMEMSAKVSHSPRTCHNPPSRLFKRSPPVI